MKTGHYWSVIAAFGFAAASPAEAACNSQCQADASKTIFTVVTQNHDNGILLYSVGFLCENKALRDQGRAQYDATLQQSINRAKTDLRTTVPNSDDYAPFAETIDSTMRVARSAEAAGVVAGLRSAFEMYPGSKAEYCQRMIAKLKK